MEQRRAREGLDRSRCADTRHGCTTAAPGFHLLFACVDLDWLNQNRCNQTYATVREGCLHLSGTHTHTNSNIHTHTHTWTGMIGQTHEGTLTDERPKSGPCRLRVLEITRTRQPSVFTTNSLCGSPAHTPPPPRRTCKAQQIASPHPQQPACCSSRFSEICI